MAQLAVVRRRRVGEAGGDGLTAQAQDGIIGRQRDHHHDAVLFANLDFGRTAEKMTWDHDAVVVDADFHGIGRLDCI